MTAISVSYTTIPDSDVDPDSPLTTGLVTNLRDNAEFVKQWVGHDFLGGAIRNHNHDGLNSAIVALTGASIFRVHGHEIFDHFMVSALNTIYWTGSGSPAIVTGTNLHYLSLPSNADIVTSKTTFRIEMLKSLLYMRCKVIGVTTDWNTADIGVTNGAGTRQAHFIDDAPADGVKAETKGSGGTQTTSFVVGGNGVDDWHVYQIDLTSTTQTVYYVDGTVVATHTVAPDASDLNVKLIGRGNFGVDYVKFHATQEGTDSSV